MKSQIYFYLVTKLDLSTTNIKKKVGFSISKIARFQNWKRILLTHKETKLLPNRVKCDAKRKWVPVLFG